MTHPAKVGPGPSLAFGKKDRPMNFLSAGVTLSSFNRTKYLLLYDQYQEIGECAESGEECRVIHAWTIQDQA